jgi:hypothetical protein
LFGLRREPGPAPQALGFSRCARGAFSGRHRKTVNKLKRYRWASPSGEAGPFFREFSPAGFFEPAPLALQNPLQSEAAGQGTKPLPGRPRGAPEHPIASGAVARKKTGGDDPRNTRAGGFFLQEASSLVPLPVAAALRLPPLPAVQGFAIALLRLPSPPLAGGLATGGTATPCQRVPRPENALTMLQETPPAPRTSSATLGRRRFTEALLFRRG